MAAAINLQGFGNLEGIAATTKPGTNRALFYFMF